MRNRVAGHTLWREGKPAPITPEGCAACSCAAISQPLPSDAARRRWHREHKLAVLAAK